MVRHVHIDDVPHTVMTVRAVSGPQGPDRQLIERLSQFRTLAELAPVGILQLGLEGSCTYANDMWRKLSRFSPDALIGRRWLDALHPDDVPSLLAAVKDEASRNRMFLGEFRLCPSPGEIIWVAIAMTALLDENGQVVGSLLVVADITEKHLLMKQLHELAHKDTLTGLLNRNSCLTRLDQLLEPAGTTEHVAVLYVDLDGFKGVNDTLGHDAGDELLRTVAGRLRSVVRPEDSVARFGGDEFAVLVPAVESSADDGRASAAAIAQRIVDSVSMPFTIADREVRIGDIAIGDGHAVARATLVKHADTAPYMAKRSGRSRYAFFSTGGDDQGHDRAVLVAAVRRAAETLSFALRYEPQICLRSGRTIGFEASPCVDPSVVPDGVAPEELIDILERDGLVVRLDRWALDSACERLALWRGGHDGLPEALTVSVRIGGEQLGLSGFADEVARTLARHALPPRCLILALAEPVLAGASSNGVIERLTAIGVQIALVDFGTESSPLAGLGRFPLDRLTLDRASVAAIGDGTNASREIARGVISLARSLGMQVTAGCVEDERVLPFLAEQRCHAWQGPLCPGPIAAERIETLLARATAP